VAVAVKEYKRSLIFEYIKIKFMDNPRVEEGESAASPAAVSQTRIKCSGQLQYKLIYFAATALVLFVFVVLTRLLLPGDNEAQSAVLKTLTQQVASFLPVHETSSSSTRACCDHVNGTATTASA
jgi:hypothetical protein